MPRKALNTQEHPLAVLDPKTLDQIRIFSGLPEERAPTVATVLPEAPQQTLMRTQTQYTTAIAVQRPRSMARMLSKVLEEARLAGESFYYYWEVEDRHKGRKVPVEGPSIDLAMSLARNYENCAVDADVTDTLTHYIFKGVFIDLETGFTYTRLFRQRKSQKVSSRMDRERQEDIVFQIGQSKTQRNAITRAMPGWVVDKAIETAKQAVLSGINPETIHLARLKVIDFFSKYGVSQAQIEAERGRPIDQWTPSDIVDLRGMATALKEGRVSPAEIFPAREPAPTEQPPPNPLVEQATPEAAPESAKPLPFAKSVKKSAQAIQPDPIVGQAVIVAEEPPKEPTKPCPDRDGKPRPVSFCNGLCPHREGCPEWD
jgi:hypothetical protein